ncbi:MAG: hypothetical protein AAFZ07_12980 [Actinomycetota bacterium]
MAGPRAAEVEGATFFAYEPAPAWGKPALLPFGLSDADGVAVTDELFVATFGRLRLEVPRSTVTGAHATGPYRWWTCVGARLSFADDGLTFGTNPVGGVCVHFEPSAPKVIGWKDQHRALTVTVVDREGLVELLGEEDPTG